MSTETRERGLYLFLRVMQTIWTILVTPLALYYYHRAGGSSFSLDLQIVPWLYAIIVITHVGQYFYPADLGGAARVTGATCATLLAGMFFSSFASVGHGFYVTFVTAIAFICLFVCVAIFFVVRAHAIKFSFFTSTLTWQEVGLFVLVIAGLGSLFFFGLVELGRPLWNEWRQGGWSALVIPLMLVQASSMVVQVIRSFRGTDDPSVQLQKKLYADPWKAVANLAFFISMLICFGLLFAFD